MDAQLIEKRDFSTVEKKVEYRRSQEEKRFEDTVRYEKGQFTHSFSDTTSLNHSQKQGRLLRLIIEIDEKINQQMNEILHHSVFKQLEASWRGLFYLADMTAQHDKSQKVKIKLLSLTWNELAKDINRAIDFDQSEFFKRVYSSEFDMAGGEPFGLILGDYQISHRPRAGVTINDIDVLKEVTRSCAAAFAPFITSAHPSMFGVNRFSELGQISEITRHFQQAEYAKWRSLRSMEDARFLGVLAPQILMRKPYQSDGRRSESFMFKEQKTSVDRDYLWGSAIYPFAAVMIRAFSDYGWFGQVRGLKVGKYNHGLVADLPKCQYETVKYQKHHKAAVNVQVGDRLEAELSDNGFIPISAVPYSDHCVFFSNASVHQAAKYNSASANVNARLSAMLQYILCVSRFAHYIKLMGRDKVGSFQSAENCQRDLQSWLQGYTTASDSASEEVRGRYPLHDARIQVKEMRGQPGHFYSIIQLQPHFQLDQMVSSIKLVTELTPRYQTIN